jgi:hypothetical protein
VLRIFLVLVLGIICTGCASSKVKASGLKVAGLEKITNAHYDKADYGECKMLPTGYLVCPKRAKN